MNLRWKHGKHFLKSYASVDQRKLEYFLSEKEFQRVFNMTKLEWYNHWRLLDIDFEAYMLMRGLPKEEFDKLNKESHGEELSKK